MQGEDGATYRYIITIPEEYNRVRTTINAEPRLDRLFPCHTIVVNSLNWSNYPNGITWERMCFIFSITNIIFRQIVTII